MEEIAKTMFQMKQKCKKKMNRVVNKIKTNISKTPTISMIQYKKNLKKMMMDLFTIMDKPNNSIIMI